MKTLLAIAATVFAIYVLVVVFYALKQRSLIYYPTTLPLDLAREQAQALDGSPWRGAGGEWWGWTKAIAAGTNGRPRRAVVFHGNAGMALNRGYYADLLAGFHESGPWRVHVFEYPGYGPRGGEPGEAAFAAAALKAVDALIEQRPEPLLIIGESIGSGVAAGIARRRPEAVAALLLITPFDSLVDVAHHHMPYLPTGLVLKDRYDNVDALKAFARPLVVVTAGQDTIIPPERAVPLLEQHPGPVLHVVQSEAGHNTLHFDPDRSPWPAIDRFIDSSLR